MNFTGSDITNYATPPANQKAAGLKGDVFYQFFHDKMAFPRRIIFSSSQVAIYHDENLTCP